MRHLGVKPQPKHAIANCSQSVSPMLTPGEYERGVGWIAIPPFAKLLRYLVLFFCSFVQFCDFRWTSDFSFCVFFVIVYLLYRMLVILLCNKLYFFGPCYTDFFYNLHWICCRLSACGESWVWAYKSALFKLHSVMLDVVEGAACPTWRRTSRCDIYTVGWLVEQGLTSHSTV